MEKKIYRYPLVMRIGEFVGAMMVVFLALTFLYYLIVSLANIIHQVANPPNRLGLLVTTFFGVFFVLYIFNLFPYIEIMEDGLLLRTPGIKIRVPWQSIKKVRRGNGYIFKVFAVESSSLTPFHRIYGILYTSSFTPCFLVWDTLPGYKKILSEIKTNIHSRGIDRPGEGTASLR